MRVLGYRLAVEGLGFSGFRVRVLGVNYTVPFGFQSLRKSVQCLGRRGPNSRKPHTADAGNCDVAYDGYGT